MKPSKQKKCTVLTAVNESQTSTANHHWEAVHLGGRVGGERNYVGEMRWGGSYIYIYVYIYIYAVGSTTWPPLFHVFVLFFCFSNIFFFLQGEWYFSYKQSFNKDMWKTSRSITWPPFPQTFWDKMWPSYWPWGGQVIDLAILTKNLKINFSKS